MAHILRGVFVFVSVLSWTEASRAAERVSTEFSRLAGIHADIAGLSIPAREALVRSFAALIEVEGAGGDAVLRGASSSVRSAAAASALGQHEASGSVASGSVASIHAASTEQRRKLGQSLGERGMGSAAASASGLQATQRGTEAALSRQSAYEATLASVASKQAPLADFRFAKRLIRGKAQDVLGLTDDVTVLAQTDEQRSSLALKAHAALSVFLNSRDSGSNPVGQSDYLRLSSRPSPLQQLIGNENALESVPNQALQAASAAYSELEGRGPRLRDKDVSAGAPLLQAVSAASRGAEASASGGSSAAAPGPLAGRWHGSTGTGSAAAAGSHAQGTLSSHGTQPDASGFDASTGLSEPTAQCKRILNTWLATCVFGPSTAKAPS